VLSLLVAKVIVILARQRDVKAINPAAKMNASSAQAKKDHVKVIIANLRNRSCLMPKGASCGRPFFS